MLLAALDKEGCWLLNDFYANDVDAGEVERRYNGNKRIVNWTFDKSYTVHSVKISVTPPVRPYPILFLIFHFKLWLVLKSCVTNSFKNQPNFWQMVTSLEIFRWISTAYHWVKVIQYTLSPSHTTRFPSHSRSHIKITDSLAAPVNQVIGMKVLYILLFETRKYSWKFEIKCPQRNAHLYDCRHSTALFWGFKVFNVSKIHKW